MSKTISELPLDELVIGRWYVGRGRNANIGLWDGEHFLVLCQVGRKVGPGSRDWDLEWGIIREPYFTDSEGCFQPFRLIDEGMNIESFGAVGWNAHYAKTIAFGADE